MLFRSLGKMFDCSLKDSVSITLTNQDLETWLKAVDKSGLPGKFKACIYQHGILPKVLWPLLLYEFLKPTVEGFKRQISHHLYKWLGLPQSLTSIALYGSANKLHLPTSGLTTEFVVTRAKEMLQYRKSSDPKITQAGIAVRTERRWKAHDAADPAQS